MNTHSKRSTHANQKPIFLLPFLLQIWSLVLTVFSLIVSWACLNNFIMRTLYGSMCDLVSFQSDIIFIFLSSAYRQYGRSAKSIFKNIVHLARAHLLERQREIPMCTTQDYTLCCFNDGNIYRIRYTTFQVMVKHS